MQTPPLELQPLKFDTALTELTGPVLLVYETQGQFVVEPGLPADKATKFRATGTNSSDPFVHLVPTDGTVSDLAGIVAADKALRAFTLPRGMTVTRFSVRSMAAKSGLIFAAASLILLAAVLLPPPVNLAVAALLLGLIFAIRRWKPGGRATSAHFFQTEDGEYALESLLDERPAALEAGRDVDAVKEEYGALLSDIIYRIENPALFDVTVPTSRAFTAALLQWDNAQGSLSGHELSTLAAKVRVTFDAARAHAERVGMSHLPEGSREPAERALKALRLAASTTSDDERKAARQQAIRILASLALYYLPDPDEAQTMIEGRRILALPGRRTTAEDGQ